MKKWSKILALTLSAAMLVLSFAACSNTGNGGDAGESGNTQAQAMPAVDKAELKIGVIHITDPAEGSGFTYTQDQGIAEMQKNLGLDDSQIIRKINISDTDAAATRTAIEECIEEGCQVIFGTSYNYMNVMKELADKYPNVIFSHCSGNINNGKNMNNYFGAIYEARYLTGIAAGMKTETNKIGFVAAMGVENSEVTGGINAFTLGVKSVNPEAQVYVKVTGQWYDPTAEAQAAQALLDAGCDVIAQHCDSAVPQTTAEAAGKWGCGYNSDMTEQAPNGHLTAPIWHWGVYYTAAVQSIIDGTWTATNYFGNIADGLVDISPLNTAVAAPGTQEKIDEARAKMADGSLKVFAGPLKDNQGNEKVAAGTEMSQEDITQHFTWYVEGVVADA
ncbi:MAG: BMP family ABC transporter substrate-binding protein [Clostridia bacterium]